MSSDLAVVCFPHLDGAEHAFADVRDRCRHAPWLDEVAFVEHRRSGRLVVRGTVAGRFLDAEEDGDVVGRHTASGTLTGGLAGLAFGPPALAAGLVTGAASGGMLEAKEAERLDGELFRDLRERVPKGESGLVLLAEASHVDAMLDALRGTDARVAVRKTLSDQAVAAVEAAVARAQGPPRGERSSPKRRTRRPGTPSSTPRDRSPKSAPPRSGRLHLGREHRGRADARRDAGAMTRDLIAGGLNSRRPRTSGV